MIETPIATVKVLVVEWRWRYQRCRCRRREPRGTSNVLLGYLSQSGDETDELCGLTHRLRRRGCPCDACGVSTAETRGSVTALSPGCDDVWLKGEKIWLPRMMHESVVKRCGLGSAGAAVCIQIWQDAECGTASLVASSTSMKVDCF